MSQHLDHMEAGGAHQAVQLEPDGASNEADLRPLDAYLALGYIQVQSLGLSFLIVIKNFSS